jgi:biotin carboxyl carrier protein
LIICGFSINEIIFIKKGQGVIVLSAMKMEITLSSAFNGTVTSVNTKEGVNVSPGDILVDIEADQEPAEKAE